MRWDECKYIVFSNCDVWSYRVKEEDHKKIYIYFNFLCDERNNYPSLHDVKVRC